MKPNGIQTDKTVGDSAGMASSGAYAKPTEPAGAPVFDAPIVFVSGKGGVGKSLVAAALALRGAQSGRKTLLVETGERSYFKDFLNLEHADHCPRPTGLGFDHALWSGESCLREYILHLLKLERIYKIFFENKVMRALVNVAPGLNEIAILGKITSGARKVGPPIQYDTIVVDMPATGHALALFRAPKGMAEAIQIGPMAQHSTDMNQLLKNKALVSLVAVTLLEELPVSETEEFVAAVSAEFDMPVEIVANRWLDISLAEAELREVQAAGLAELSEYAGGVADSVHSQREQLDRLLARFGSVYKIPRYYSKSAADMVRAAEADLREALRKH